MSKFKIIDEVVIDEDLNIKVIRRANSPKWYVQYNLPGVGQRRKTLKTTSKKEAKRLGRAFARDFTAGDVLACPMKRHTVQDVAEQRRKRQSKLNRSPKTIKHTERFDKQLMIFLPKGGATPIQGLTASALEAFEDELRTTGIAIPSPDGRGKRQAGPMQPKSLRDAMKSTRGLIRFALKRGMLNSDPSSAYDLPPAPEQDIEVFSAEDLAALYEDPGPGLADIWRLLTQTCLRIGEFMWLMKEDVIVDDAGHPVALNICKKVCPFTGKAWNPKHGLERVVPLAAEAVRIVAEALKSSQTPWLFESPVSRGKQTGMWTYSPLLNRLNARQDAAGIERASPHRFRHTGATYLANDAAMPIAQLKKFLGHKDIQMVMRYLHPRAEHVQDTIARVDFDRLINNSVASTTAIDTAKRESPKTVNSQSTPGKPACAAGA